MVKITLAFPGCSWRVAKLVENRICIEGSRCARLSALFSLPRIHERMKQSKKESADFSLYSVVGIRERIMPSEIVGACGFVRNEGGNIIVKCINAPVRLGLSMFYSMLGFSGRANETHKLKSQRIYVY